MIRKLICAILALLMICSVAGCKKGGKNNNTSEVKPPEVKPTNQKMQLIYCLSDTFNPYTAATAINRELCGLLYDSLIKLDNKFNPVYGLAQDVQIENKKCTVTLRDALFSDGSAVTADDVVYSFKLAKASKTEYASKLYEIESASAKGGKTVVFSLTKNDVYAANLLDFPVLKAGSEDNTDADGVLHPPMGSGRYVLNAEKDVLVRNENYYGKKGSVPNINLINAPDAESLSHYVEIGATDIYFTDVSDGTIVRMSGKKTDINLTDFVYIGINEENEILSNLEIRYAISSALNRQNICQTAYYNNAVAASGFFHPDFEPVKSLQNIKKSSDFKIAIENLEKIGYNSLNSSGYRVNASKKHLALTLLVNSENPSRLKAAEMIANQLKQVGIELRIIKRNYADYMTMLKNGDFQLYLGETRLTANMDFSELLLPGGAIAFGRTERKPEKDKDASTKDESTDKTDENPTEPVAPATAAQIISGFYEGTYSITDVASVLLTELPVIPVCYRNGLLFYDPDVVNLSKASKSDVYYSNETGHTPG